MNAEVRNRMNQMADELIRHLSDVLGPLDIQIAPSDPRYNNVKHIYADYVYDILFMYKEKPLFGLLLLFKCVRKNEPYSPISTSIYTLPKLGEIYQAGRANSSAVIGILSEVIKTLTKSIDKQLFDESISQ